MFNRLKALTVFICWIVFSPPVMAQSEKFMVEFGVWQAATAALTADSKCQGLAINKYAVAMKLNDFSAEIRHRDWLMSIFGPVHNETMRILGGLDNWCAHQWHLFGSKGVMFKDFLYRVTK